MSAKGSVEEVGGFLPVDPRQCAQLNHVEAALAGFGLGDEGLRPPEQVAHLLLCHSRVLPRLPKSAEKGALVRRATTHHGAEASSPLPHMPKWTARGRDWQGGHSDRRCRSCGFALYDVRPLLGVRTGTREAPARSCVLCNYEDENLEALARHIFGPAHSLELKALLIHPDGVIGRRCPSCSFRNGYLPLVAYHMAEEHDARPDDALLEAAGGPRKDQDQQQSESILRAERCQTRLGWFETGGGWLTLTDRRLVFAGSDRLGVDEKWCAALRSIEAVRVEPASFLVGRLFPVLVTTFRASTGRFERKFERSNWGRTADHVFNGWDAAIYAARDAKHASAS